MQDYSVFLCKPAQINEDGKDILESLVAANCTQEDGESTNFLHKIPSREIVNQFKIKFPLTSDDGKDMTLRTNEVNLKLTYNWYYIKFEQLGVQFSTEPYEELELLAGKYGCVIYDPQTRFTTRNLPGSLVRTRQSTLLEGVYQIPLAQLPAFGDYLGTISEDTEQISKQTGILFEQMFESIDYVDIAYVEIRNINFVLRKFLRMQNSAVDLWSMPDSPSSPSFEDLLKILQLRQRLPDD